MTRDSLLALLRELEFSGWNHDGYDPGGGYCPSCGVDHESDLAFEPGKHGGECKLAAAIAWLTDEKNITNGGCCNVDGWLLEDGR